QYQVPLSEVIAQATVRSLALLVGVAVFALVVGVLIGISAALLRRRAIASGAALGLTSVIAAVPSFFLAYFLQILFIFIGVAVASLPIVEYILVWNGIGFVALQAIALRDPVALTACAIVLGGLFTLTSLLLDLRRTRFH